MSSKHTSTLEAMAKHICTNYWSLLPFNHSLTVTCEVCSTALVMNDVMGAGYTAFSFDLNKSLSLFLAGASTLVSEIRFSIFGPNFSNFLLAGVKL